YLIVHVAIDSTGVFRGRFDRGSGGDPPEMKWEKKLDVPDEDLYAGGRAFTRIRLALCEAHPNVLYAVFASNPGSGIAEHNHASFVFRSDDNGDDWQIRGRIPRAFLCDDSGGPNNGQASYDLLLEANPSNPDVVVCGEIDVCLSTDRAGTWT